MSKFTDDLLELFNKTLDKYSLDAIFLNFGHAENEERFEDCMNELCYIDNLYVVYKYEIYYHGEVVTDETLKQSFQNAAVLPVLGKGVLSVSNSWRSIFEDLDPKRRTEPLLRVLTNKYSLIEDDIYSPSFYSYTVFLCNSVVIENLTGRRHFSDFVDSNVKHNLIVADAGTLNEFKLALKKFFEQHMSVQL